MGANDPKTDYIIIEHSQGKYLSYRESEEHFMNAEKSRKSSGLKKVSETLLDEECDLSRLPENTYIVINVNSKSSCAPNRSNDLMIDIWGERCEEYDPLNASCVAWEIYDSTGLIPLTHEVSDRIQEKDKDYCGREKSESIDHWDCRLVRKFCEESGEEYVAVYEVYYDEEDNPLVRTDSPIHVDGNSLKDVKKYFKTIKKAMKKPVLDDSIFEK